jgi:hypothetical protein
VRWVANRLTPWVPWDLRRGIEIILVKIIPNQNVLSQFNCPTPTSTSLPSPKGTPYFMSQEGLGNSLLYLYLECNSLKYEIHTNTYILHSNTGRG